MEVFQIGLCKPAADRGEPVILPRTEDPETPIRSGSWLRHQNLDGRNAYVRPSGEHGFASGSASEGDQHRGGPGIGDESGGDPGADWRHFGRLSASLTDRTAPGRSDWLVSFVRLIEAAEQGCGEARDNGTRHGTKHNEAPLKRVRPK
jgi:hypothetical protein